MGNDKARNTMMMIAGGYLIYLGYGLIQDVLTEELDNEYIFWIFGILFIVVGAYVVFQRGRDVIQFNYDEVAEDDVIDADAEITSAETIDIEAAGKSAETIDIEAMDTSVQDINTQDTDTQI